MEQALDCFEDIKREMIEKLALARYSPYLKHSYVNNQGAIRWYPSRPANSFYFKSVYKASEEYDRKLSVNLGKLTFEFNILENQSKVIRNRYIRNSLVHRDFTSHVYKLVSIPYYENISYNALPKRNVDYFDFEKYEHFDSVEKNIIDSHHEVNLSEVKQLKCPLLTSYAEIFEYVKD